MNWLSLSKESDLDKILQDSLYQPQAIFKHSTRCAISSMAHSRLENSWEKTNPQTPIYKLDLIQYRSLSNKIADLFDVNHESPQLIIVDKGKAIFNTSHLGVSSSSASKHIQK